MNPPKVLFIYAYPLDQGRRALFEKNGLGKYPTIEEVQTRIKFLSQLWDEIENKHEIIKLLIELTGRTPERSLECFVYGMGLGAMSAPLLIPTHKANAEVNSNEIFIETVIHELLHIFVTTQNKEYWEAVQKQYRNENPLCQNHIIVYAFLADICKKLFDATPLDFSHEELPPDYTKAINFVKEIGYEKLIEEYRSLL